MPVKVRCPQCSKELAAPDAARGKAIRCPDCQTKIAVPAEASASPAKSSSARPVASSGKSPVRKAAPRPAKPEAVSNDDDFLSGLDLRHAEDRTVRVCAKCGKPVGEDEFECPYCGMDSRTGQMTAIARKKATTKGPDPEEFSGIAWSDPWKFTISNKSLVFRSIAYTLLTFTLFAGCMYMAWMIAERLPPRCFWMIFALSLAMVIPGWYWNLMMIVIARTMSKKADAGVVHFDMFLNMASGLKLLVWNLVFYGIPAIIPAIPIGIAALLINSKAWLLLLAVLPIVSFLQPAGVAHMAMPVTARGWLSPLLVRPVFKTFGRTLYVMLILFVMNILPVALIGGGLWIINWDRQQPYFVYYDDPQPAIKDLEEVIRKARDVKKKTPEQIAAIEVLDDRLKEMQKTVDTGDEKLNPAYKKLSGFRNLDWSRPTHADPILADAYDHRGTWWMWMLTGSGLLLTGLLTLTFTAVFSMRLIGQYAYYFHERLELITEPPEEEFVRMLPHRGGLLIGMVITAALLPMGGGLVGAWAMRMAKFDLEDMKTGRRDPKGRKKTKQAIKISQIISIFWLMVTTVVIFTWSLGVWPFSKDDSSSPAVEEKAAVEAKP